MKFSKTPYTGKKKIKPIIILITVWEPAISTQFDAIYWLSEPKKAVAKKIYESIILEIIVDNAGASHHLE